MYRVVSDDYRVMDVEAGSVYEALIKGAKFFGVAIRAFKI